MIVVAYWSRSSVGAGPEVGDHVVDPIGEAQPHHRALMPERPVGDAPAAVERADEVLGGHPRVGEEHLVEVHVVLAGHVGERPAHHAGRGGGNDQRADALVLGRVRVGAHERQQEVGVVGAGCPHLLTVDHEVVTSRQRTARVRSDARSEPALGSLMPSDAVSSALSTGTAQRCFCSSDPNESNDAAMMFTPCGLWLW